MEAFTSSWPCADGSVPARWQIGESFDGVPLPADACCFARPRADSPACEVAAAFRAAACAVRLQIISSARTCEVYLDDDGGTGGEYFGTIRALPVRRP